MDGVEGEDVVGQVERNREWTQIDANFWERDRPGRCGARLATRPGKKDTGRNVFGGTPNTAVETTALPKNRISEHLRLFASIRGSAPVLDISALAYASRWFSLYFHLFLIHFLKAIGGGAPACDFKTIS
jgi:hypothetical protein